MYRDCLRAAGLMAGGNADRAANIKLHFRAEFDKQKTASEEEHKVFREGMTRLLSNFMAYEVKTQYLANPTKFERTTNIYEQDDSEIDAVEVGPMGAFDESHSQPNK